jgi:RNA polymerase sigma factor (sigma-70 family)
VSKGIVSLTRYTSMVQRDGVSESFERFFAATRDHVYRSLLVITRDQALADDGVAEAYARAFERWPDVANHPAPKAWVARTALNYVRSDRRRARRIIFGMPDVPAPERDLPDPQLVALVLRLPRRQREVIALRILLDLSTERTAELLGIAPGTAGAHLSKALARLERELVGTGITEVEG